MKKTNKENKKEKYTYKKFLSNIAWSYRWMFKMSPIESAILLLITIFQNIVPIFSAYLYAKIIDFVVKIIANYQTVSSIHVTREILIIIGIYSGITFLRNILGIIKSHISEKSWLIWDELVYQQYFAKVSSLDIPQHEDSEIANDIKKGSDNLGRVYDLYNETNLLIGIGISLLSSTFIVLKFDPILIIIAVLLATPSTLIELDQTLRRRKVYEGNMETMRKSWNLSYSVSDDKNLPEIKVNKVRNKILNYGKFLRSILNKQYLELIRRVTKGRTFLSVLSLGDIFTGFFVLRRILLTGKTIGDFNFYWGQASNVSSDLSSMFSKFVYIYDRSKTLEYVRNVMDLKPLIVNGTKKVKFGKNSYIEFKNVSFKYPKSKSYVFRNLSLKIMEGEEVAIVGENGAGKTTLIRLLLRFYDPTEGDICIDGVNLKDIDLNSYYEYTGALFQDFNKYYFYSIKNNIGISKSRFTNISIKQAAKIVDIDKDIMALPKNFKHLISKNYDNGVNLSKGQEQKIALARMFYRNPPILILDEPTASIDAVAEFKIFKQIYEFMDNKTVIIISHRFSTVRNAQKIFVLDKGRLVEEGSHKELMDKKGRYHKAFTLQAKGYEN